MDYSREASIGILNTLFTNGYSQQSQHSSANDAIKRIGGHAVNTSGKAAVHAEYEAIQRQISEMTKAELSAALQTKNLNVSTEDFIAFLKSSGQSTADGYGADAEWDPSNPYETRFRHTAATHFAFTALPELSSVNSGLGFIPGDIFTSNSKQALLSHQRQGVEKLLGELQLEQEVQKEFGADAKIAFDQRAGNYIVLKPGDIGYDQVNTGAEALSDTYDFFRKGFADINDFADIFAKYGYPV